MFKTTRDTLRKQEIKLENKLTKAGAVWMVDHRTRKKTIAQLVKVRAKLYG